MAISFGHRVEITTGALAGRRGNIRGADHAGYTVRLDTGEDALHVPAEALRVLRGRPFRVLPLPGPVVLFS